MTQDIAQAQPAAHTDIPHEQDTLASGPALVLKGLFERTFGPKAIAIEQPFPAVNEHLVQQVALVHKALEHAREHIQLKGATLLLSVHNEYEKIVRAELVRRSKADRSKYAGINDTYISKPHNEAERRISLATEFELAGNGSSLISRFFHARNNRASEYIWKNRKEEGLSELIVRI